MSECLSEQAASWEKRLNEEYRAALGRAEVKPQALRAAQRLWVRYREANCGTYSTISGSISRIAASLCFRDVTRARTLELHEMRWTG